MSSTENPKNDDVIRKLNLFLKTRKEEDFNALFESLTRDIIYANIIPDFIGFWKIDKVYENLHGIDSLKNDVLLHIYRSEELDIDVNSIFSRHILSFLKDKKKEFIEQLDDILEYQFSVSYRNFFTYMEINSFFNFLLIEIFTIIFEVLHEMMIKGEMILFYHFLLLLNRDQIEYITDVEDIDKSLLQEMDHFWLGIGKQGVFPLLSIFMKEEGDLEEFGGRLIDTDKDILRMRLSKTPYKIIDEEFGIKGSREILYRALNDYLNDIYFTEEILREQKYIERSDVIWRLLCPALINETTEFIGDLFSDENKEIFKRSVKDTNINWKIKRDLEVEMKFPYCYIEQFKFSTEIIELFSPS